MAVTTPCTTFFLRPSAGNCPPPDRQRDPRQLGPARLHRAPQEPPRLQVHPPGVGRDIDRSHGRGFLVPGAPPRVGPLRLASVPRESHPPRVLAHHQERLVSVLL